MKKWRLCSCFVRFESLSDIAYNTGTRRARFGGDVAPLLSCILLLRKPIDLSIVGPKKLP